MAETTRNLNERCPNGVFRIDAAQRTPVSNGQVYISSAHIAVLDGRQAGTRATVLAEMARTLDFPGYFGQNWDAVNDCLTDPSLFPLQGLVLIWDAPDAFIQAEPEQWRIAVKVLGDACAFWQGLARPMYALIVVSPDLVPEIPAAPEACLATE